MELDAMLKNLALVKSIYSRELFKSEPAMSYLLSRVSEDSIKTFKLGYCASSNSASYLLRSLLSKKDILQLGLFAERGDDIIDRFVNRIIFPVNLPSGTTVGFVGRALGESKFKYLNSEDCFLFKRSDFVFGLDVALPHILERGFVFLCEGLFDAIALHEAGFKNVVASLGTTTARSQLQNLSYFTDSIVIIFDGDSAGRAGTLFTRAQAQSLNFRTDVIELPENEDPSSLLKSLGVNAFRNFINANIIL